MDLFQFNYNNNNGENCNDNVEIHEHCDRICTIVFDERIPIEFLNSLKTLGWHVYVFDVSKKNCAFDNGTKEVLQTFVKKNKTTLMLWFCDMFLLSLSIETFKELFTNDFKNILQFRYILGGHNSQYNDNIVFDNERISFCKHIFVPFFDTGYIQKICGFKNKNVTSLFLGPFDFMNNNSNNNNDDNINNNPLLFSNFTFDILIVCENAETKPLLDELIKYLKMNKIKYGVFSSKTICPESLCEWQNGIISCFNVKRCKFILVLRPLKSQSFIKSSINYISQAETTILSNGQNVLLLNCNDNDEKDISGNQLSSFCFCLKGNVNSWCKQILTLLHTNNDNDKIKFELIKEKGQSFARNKLGWEYFAMKIEEIFIRYFADINFYTNQIKHYNNNNEKINQNMELLLRNWNEKGRSLNWLLKPCDSDSIPEQFDHHKYLQDNHLNPKTFKSIIDIYHYYRFSNKSNKICYDKNYNHKNNSGIINKKRKHEEIDKNNDDDDDNDDDILIIANQPPKHWSTIRFDNYNFGIQKVSIEFTNNLFKNFAKGCSVTNMDTVIAIQEIKETTMKCPTLNITDYLKIYLSKTANQNKKTKI